MRSTTLLLSALAATATAAPNRDEKRQGDLAELLGLASYAGITALPTNPTALLQLGQAAGPLESALPTAPVLSVLETAAPKNFISDILYNPSYASSFESAFAAGSSPSWFNGLPTDVKSYLHTYSGFGNLAAGAAALNSGLASASASGGGVVVVTTGASSATTGASGTVSGSTGSGGAAAGSTGSGGAAAGSTGSGSMSMTSMATMTSSGSMTTPTGGSSTGGAGAAGQSSAAAATTSSAKAGGASRLDGAVAAGLAGVVGILGLALAL